MNLFICGAVTQAKIVKRANGCYTAEQVLSALCFVMVLKAIEAKRRNSSRRAQYPFIPCSGTSTTCISL